MMKTRQEMVYDFMLQLATGWSANTNNVRIDYDMAGYLRKEAEVLADEYLQFMSGN
jgi:hypothetical protein